MNQTSNEYLVYVNLTAKNNDNTYEYDFYFSNNPDNVWGVDWNVYNPSSCSNLEPEPTTINEIKHVTTNMPLKTAQDTTFYPMEYCTCKILALAWIDISNMEEYPENGRMVFHFGDEKEKVTELLSLYDFNFND